MKENQNKAKRGRKPVTLTWPEEEFTARQVASQMEGKLSRVSVHSKINNAVKNGEVTIVRKTEGKMGRPCLIYKKN